MKQREQRYWDERQERWFEAVPTDSVLTHLGRVRRGSPPFDEEPLWRSSEVERWVEVDVSMIEGELSIEDTVRLVRHRPQRPRDSKRDCIRCFRAGDLIQAGFYPMRTPSRQNPHHVSIYGDMELIMERAGKEFGHVLIDQPAHRWWWGVPVRVTLESKELLRRLPRV